MNEFHPLITEHARDLVSQRGATRRRRDATMTGAGGRRTTRRVLARGLHRVADRLDGGL